MKQVIITGSEGLLGKEISNYLEKKHTVYKFSKSLGDDLTDEKHVKEIFKETKADCLVNLFGLSNPVDSTHKQLSLFDISLESVKDYLNLNTVSLFSVCREFARNNKKGSIINISSIYSVNSPDPSLYDGNKHIGYCISKAGVVSLTKYLAVHLAPDFRVNCISPGGVLHKQSQEFIEKYSVKVPLKRMMNVDEINELVAFLCSDASSYCTGSNFIVDGGYTII